MLAARGYLDWDVHKSKSKDLQESRTQAASAAYRTLRELGKPVLSYLPEYFHMKDMWVRDLVLELGVTAVPMLRACLDSNDFPIQREALYLLAHIRDKSAVDGLVQATKNRNRAVQSHAIKMMSEGDPHTMMPILVDYMMDSTDEDRQAWAIVALGNLGHPDALEPMTEFLDSHPSERLRLATLANMQRLDYPHKIEKQMAHIDSLKQRIASLQAPDANPRAKNHLYRVEHRLVQAENELAVLQTKHMMYQREKLTQYANEHPTTKPLTSAS